MNEMVERVARALWEVGCNSGDPIFDELNPERQRALIALARTAITAMREPAKAMCEAACMDGLEGLVAVHLADVMKWHAMIDAALTDG